jgi:succinyl-CoA synthetase beta subunit
MILAVRGLAVLTGYRNLPAGDVGALADAIVSVSALANLPADTAVAEAEVNPLLVRADGAGCVALDALVIRSS